MFKKGTNLEGVIILFLLVSLVGIAAIIGMKSRGNPLGFFHTPTAPSGKQTLQIGGFKTSDTPN